MSHISVPSPDDAIGASATLFAQIKKSVGKVPNTYAALGALAPGALQTMLQADGVLAAGTLDKKDLETIRLIVSEVAGCSYCLAAHVMLAKMSGLKADDVKAIRAGQPTGDAKRDALARLVRLLQTTKGELSDSAFADVKAAGYTDAQMAEIALAIASITFTNVFNRINNTDVDFPPID